MDHLAEKSSKFYDVISQKIISDVICHIFYDVKCHVIYDVTYHVIYDVTCEVGRIVLSGMTDVFPHVTIKLAGWSS